MNVAIVGGGAAGFFLAVVTKELCPKCHVTIYESGSKPMRKVKVSGGGRCNLSNSFNGVNDLKTVYPRGHKLMKRLFKLFSPADAQQWWREHGVDLVTQDDECVFPVTQNSQTVIDTLIINAQRLGVKVLYETRVESLSQLLEQYDCVCVATGGFSKNSLYEELAALGHKMVEPVPSLFTFSVEDESLRSLMGLVANSAELKIPGSKLRADGPVLITHWGLSGPATLKLSSYAARFLAENNYRSPVSVNWLYPTPLADIERHISDFIKTNPKKEVTHCPFPQIQNRLWQHLVARTVCDGGSDSQISQQWGNVSNKFKNKLIETLTNDIYEIVSRYKFKDEFVTSGGVDLSSLNANTLESKSVAGLFFAGEALDIDGVTGGFNFQACWTTAMTVARSLAQRL